MFGFLKRGKPYYSEGIVSVDIHSHLLPAIDDGSRNIDETILLIKGMQELGYKKFITTPHIMSGSFPNTPRRIGQKLKATQKFLEQKGLNVHLQAAAEYYLDEVFVETVQSKKRIMSFGNKKYVLFETGFLQESMYFNHTLFALSNENYTPILAHPERYIYLQRDYQKVEECISMGALLQINTTSLSGYYGPAAKRLAEWLIDHKLVHFIGSDMHHERHLKALQSAHKTKYYEKLEECPLLNDKV